MPEATKFSVIIKPNEELDMAIKDVQVLIGRFNPFHRGHAYVLEQALRTSKLVIVLVGSAGKSRSPKNPFTFAERKKMINQWYADANIPGTAAHSANLSRDSYTNEAKSTDTRLVVLPIRDFASNNTWIKSVQGTVKSAMTSVCLQQNITLADVYITGSSRDDSTWYLDAFPQWKKNLVQPLQHKPGQSDDLSATSVRRVLYESNLTKNDLQSLAAKLPPSTLQFIETFCRVEPEHMARLRLEYKVIEENKAKWKAAPHKPTFMCADAVIIQSGHVLMIQRANQPGRGLWALPGGYVNQQERVRDAAIREALEETGIRLTTGKNAEEITKRMLDGAIRAKEFFDDPGRSERGRTFTMAYLMRLDDTKPLPPVSGQNVPHYESNGEEIVETFAAEWKPLGWVQDHSEQIFEDHEQIIEVMVAKMDE
jgi:bifunctional NMN adenylyltransferase/nudix hydrolase